MTGLFDSEAFEQMPGQMSMEAVEPTFAGKDAQTARELRPQTGSLVEIHRDESGLSIRGRSRSLFWQPPCGSAHCAWLERCGGRDDCPCGIGDES